MTAALIPLGDALISEDQRYRYWLTRTWDDGPTACWVMLNPSTADADADDPTITRCMRRVLRWRLRGVRYGGLAVVNLFALRATDPRELAAAGLDAAIGPDNDRHILTGAYTADTVVAAWGAHKPARARAAAVLGLLAGVELWCLSVTESKDPGHPLFLPYDAPLMRYDR